MQEMQNGELPYLGLILRRPVLAAVVVLTVAAVLRFAFVGADLPVFVSSAQDDVYNTSWYVADAQYIVQGREPLYEEGSLKALWTGYFAVVFYLLGVGIWQGNAGAAVLGVACVYLIYILVRRAAGQGPAFIALLLSATNFILVVYSRTPLPYIGACAASTLCLYLWYILRSRPWLQPVPYLLTVVFAFTLKSLCIIVLPVMAITEVVMLVRGERAGLLRKMRQYAIIVGGTVVLAVVANFAFGGAAWAHVRSRLSAYIGEVGVVEWLRGVLSVGFETRYFTQMPIVVFLALLYPALLLLRWRTRPEGELRLGIACSVYMLISMAAFGFLEYRSLHYFIVMSPPMIIMSALCIRELASTTRLGGARRNLPALTAGFLLITHLAYQAVSAITVGAIESGGPRALLDGSVGINVLTDAMTLNTYGLSWALPLAAVIALALVAAWRLLRARLPGGELKLPGGLAGRIAAAILAASVVLNLVFYARLLTQREYSVARAPGELPAVLGAGAVVSEHGCSLAGYGNRLATERMSFNFRDGRTKAKNPTHLFLNSHRARKLTRPQSPFEEGKHAIPIALLSIKHSLAILYRLKKLPAAYQLSGYEEGIELLRQGRPGPAVRKLRQECERYPASGLLRCALGVAVFKTGRAGEAAGELREALALMPGDFVASSYLAAAVTLTGRYGEALEKLERMRDYYVFDLRLKVVAFDYREYLLAAGGEGPQGAPSRKLLDTVFSLLAGLPPGLRADVSGYRDTALAPVRPELLTALKDSPGARAAAVAREQFAAALEAGDFDRAADALNRLSRLGGRRKPLRFCLEELHPIGITRDFPLDSVDVSGAFLRRRLFYSQVAAFIAAVNEGEGERILGAFDWALRCAWPLHAASPLSGRNPYEVAISGSAVAGETGWLFCTVLENLGFPSVLFIVDAGDETRLPGLLAVGHAQRWYLFAPDTGLPLVVGNSSRVATVRDLLAGRARLPGEELLRPATFGAISMLLPAEAQAYLPGAAVLEDLLDKEHFRCHRTMGEIDAFTSLVSAVSAAGNVQFRIWPYPFHVESGIDTGVRDLIEAGQGELSEKAYLQARQLQLTGACTEALAVLGERPGSELALTVAEARLAAGDAAGALKALEGTSFRGSRGDRAAFVTGKALTALGRYPEAVESYRKITGLRAALGGFLAEKALRKEEPHFTIPGE